jgi:hypothetical protein
MMLIVEMIRDSRAKDGHLPAAPAAEGLVVGVVAALEVLATSTVANRRRVR